MKTSELTGVALDWAVAQCEHDSFQKNTPNPAFRFDYFEAEYSTDWAQGGPIIEQNECWPSRYYGAAEHRGKVYQATLGCHYAQGPTPLIAAMRCYAVSELGDEVEIPEELKP